MRILTEGSVGAFLGNNHILDYGKAGAESTIRRWKPKASPGLAQ